VPLRFTSSTATASSLIGEIGALAGGLLPNAMGIGKQYTGSFAPGFLCGLLLSVAALMALLAVTRQWTSSWIGAGGRALEPG
jgi:NNP family nitrate/nitrite transporter-like MFS transporter